MFEHFCFGVAVHPSEQSLSEVSPDDNSFSATPRSEQTSPSLGPRSSIMDLASQLDGHSITHEDDEIRTSEWSLPTPPLDGDFGFCDRLSNISSIDEDELSLRSLSPLPATPNTSYRCRRAQRQMNAQLLCTSMQQKSIGTLVAEMVADSSQCNVIEANNATTTKIITSVLEPIIPDYDSEPAFTMEDVDEGFFEGDDSMSSQETLDQIVMSMRRSQGPTGIWKYGEGLLGHRRAGDWVQQTGSTKCPPRVRRKIGRRKTAAERAASRAT